MLFYAYLQTYKGRGGLACSLISMENVSNRDTSYDLRDAK